MIATEVPLLPDSSRRNAKPPEPTGRETADSSATRVGMTKESASRVGSIADRESIAHVEEPSPTPHVRQRNGGLRRSISTAPRRRGDTEESFLLHFVAAAHHNPALVRRQRCRRLSGNQKRLRSSGQEDLLKIDIEVITRDCALTEGFNHR